MWIIGRVYLKLIFLSSWNRKCQFFHWRHISVTVCLSLFNHHILSVDCLKSRGRFFSVTTVYVMMCTNNGELYGLKVVFVCFHTTLFHYYHDWDLAESVEYITSLTLSQWSSSGNPVAIQCAWTLDPSVHWNATGEMPVCFQWSSSGFPVVFQCVPIMQINTGSPLEHHWVQASASVVPVASQCTCGSSGLPVCSNYAN